MSVPLLPEKLGPEVVAGIGNGVGKTTPVPTVVSGGTDERGIVAFGSGEVPTAGVQVLVSFRNPSHEGDIPFVYLQEINAATKVLGCIPTGISGAGFAITMMTAPRPRRGPGTFLVEYYVKS